MTRWLLSWMFFALCQTFWAAPVRAGMENPHVGAGKDACPEVAQRYAAPEDIPLRKGLVDLPDLGAQLNLPPSMRFVGPQDAKAYMRNANQWPKCSVAPLAGLIVPQENWLKAGDWQHPDSWMIEVYYHPGYVSDEDLISTDYNEIVQQVRESYYDREQADSAWGGQGEYRHVIGWAIPPESNAWNDSLIWSLHIAEGNQTNYSVPIHAAILGRHGYFRLYMRGLISRNETNSAIMRQSVQSLTFQKRWRHSDRFVGKDREQVTTIGKIVAESLSVRLATPVTWKEYYSAVSYWLWKLVIHYALELLAFATITAIAILVSFGRRSLSSRAYHDVDLEDDDIEDDRPPPASSEHPKPVVRLNGIAISR
jgi:uncharacterized membrane-anchored protein